MFLRHALLASAGLLVFAAPGCVSAPEQSLQSVGKGAYALEKSHASVTFEVKHFGLSWYTMRFNGIDATLDFDPDRPEASQVTAIIDPMSIDANHPDKDAEWDLELATDDKFLKGEEFPQIVFKSTQIETTGHNTGVVTGDLTMRGVTKPVAMNVVYNGSNSLPWAPGKTMIGFSATGAFNRSEFGMTAMLPNIVSDEVRFRIEVEFEEAGAK